MKGQLHISSGMNALRVVVIRVEICHLLFPAKWPRILVIRGDLLDISAEESIQCPRWALKSRWYMTAAYISGTQYNIRSNENDDNSHATYTTSAGGPNARS